MIYPKEATYILSCEHASPKVPNEFKPKLYPWIETLDLHRIYDLGALEIGKKMARRLKAPFFQGEYTRLLVDLNRSLQNPELHSELIATLSDHERATIIQHYYTPYRTRVEQAIEQALLQGKPVIHISVHSFTPILNGKERDAEFGVLFDPDRPAEAEFCENWLKTIQDSMPRWRCWLNYPYHGADDGFTTALRQRFPVNYLGIELEFNQKLPLQAFSTQIARKISPLWG